MKFFLPAFLFFPILLSAQQIIRGRVVEEGTGTPVVSASVFVSNTSKGTTTDNGGHFLLSDVPVGKHDLIISSVGYNTNVFPFNSEQLPLQLKIELQVKVKEMETVLVEPSVEEGWDKWGRTFFDNFMGTTPNARQCRILNTGDIKFRFYKKSNRIIAYADKPIQIENNALGYDISYQLEEFEVNFKDGSVFYLGYPLFKSRGLGNDIKAKWRKKREVCWNGSVMHFMKSLYHNRLQEEGFQVRRMVRTYNKEKARVRALYKGMQQTIQHNSSTGTITTKIINAPSGLATDSVSYYQQVLNQRDYLDEYGAQLITADSLVTDSNETSKAIWFENYLYVVFTKEKEDPEYVVSQMQNRNPGNQMSWVTLLNNQVIVMDASGNYADQRYFFTTGYWSWSEKMADTLPLDYLPGD